MSQRHSIALAGGSTGGHVIPIKNLIEFFESPDFLKKLSAPQRVLRFISDGQLEQRVRDERSASNFPASIQLEFITLPTAKRRRQKTFSALLANLRELFSFFTAIFRAARALRRHRVQSLFAKGWFVSLPAAIAAFFLRIPVVVHDSDISPGLANRRTARRAQHKFSGFPGVLRAQPVGQILSDDLRNPSDFFQNFSKKNPKLSPKKTRVLVMGGSLGSEFFNREILEFAREIQDLGRDEFHFLTLAGFAATNSTRFSLEIPANISQLPFLSQRDLASVYQHADLAITRGGTTALAEQKLFKLRSIIVPIPRTHDQTKNAARYREKFDDRVLPQSAEDFREQLRFIFSQLRHHKKKFKLDPAKLRREIQTAKISVSDALLAPPPT